MTKTYSKDKSWAACSPATQELHWELVEAFLTRALILSKVTLSAARESAVEKFVPGAKISALALG